MNAVRMLRESFARLINKERVQARMIYTWQAGRPVSPTDDYVAFAKDGYQRNPLIAACIREIATSASEPTLKVKRRMKDGTLEEARGSDADALRDLLQHPNPEQSTYTFLEELFTFQQLTGNWFFRKIRSVGGSNVVALWPLKPQHTKIVPGADGWVLGYRYIGVRELIPVDDVVHDPLQPDPLNDFWGLSPLASLRRAIDVGNLSFDFLRAYFTNNATPAGILKLKGRVETADRERIKEMWTKEHVGEQGWHSISVLDADAEYEEIGTNLEKLRLQVVWDQIESAICSVLGVPPILVGAVVGLNRSTFSNYAEARRSFWEETLITLYKRCAQRFTKGLASEFASDLVIEFDLTTVSALQEQREVQRKFAIDGWMAGLLTLDQALDHIGLPRVGGAEGSTRKQAAPVSSGLAGLLSQPPGPREQHTHTRTGDERRALRRFKRVASAHFKAQGDAVLAHIMGGT